MNIKTHSKVVPIDKTNSIEFVIVIIFLSFVGYEVYYNSNHYYPYTP